MRRKFLFGSVTGDGSTTVSQKSLHIGYARKGNNTGHVNKIYRPTLNVLHLFIFINDFQ